MIGKFFIHGDYMYMVVRMEYGEKALGRVFLRVIKIELQIKYELQANRLIIISITVSYNGYSS